MAYVFVDLINFARENPERASLDLHSQLANKFEGTEMNAFGKRIETFEGAKVLDEMCHFMRKQYPTGQLVSSSALSKAAESIAQEKGYNGDVTHEAPLTIHKKVEQYCRMEGKVGELMCFGTNSAVQTYSYFMMDDGLASRKRRRMLLDPQYRYIGIGIAPHRIHGTITVILLSDKLSN